jgi:RNA polymerase sigma-70 factor, ECF subfamily
MSVRPGVHAAYTSEMAVAEQPLVPVATAPCEVDDTSRPVDPAGHLAEVYRDFPGLRALILRRVRDPEIAADILQDAAVTTLEKLRGGNISRPENIGGFLYRVALNHVRNYRRKDRAPVTSSDDLESLPSPQGHVEWEGGGRRDWARIAQRVLAELPTARDRELLVRFYLRDEDKNAICAELGLSNEHFHRVIFRARNRFRALLEAKGFATADFLAIGAVALALAATGAVPIASTQMPRVAQATSVIAMDFGRGGHG